MNINSTLKLTLLLLAVMSLTGTASAFLGFQAGYIALKGVSQPEINPTKKLTDRSQSAGQPAVFVPLNEKTILKKVNEHVQQQSKRSAKQAEKDDNSSDSTAEPAQKAVQLPQFPLKVRDRDVTLEVVKATWQEGALLLAVSLTNESQQAVQFLYSFLEATDNRGRSISAIVEGLPEELPPNGEKFAGTLKIPSGMLDETQTLTLNLTDYPEQKLKLKVSGITAAP